MIEEEVYDRVIAYLEKLNSEAKAIDPDFAELVAVRRAYEDRPRPIGSYATVNLISTRDLREVDCSTFQERTVGGEMRVIRGAARAIEFLIRAEVYASRPTDFARLLQVALRTDQANLDLHPLVVRRIDGIARQAELVQQRHEGRANFDFGVAGVVVENLLIDVIESGNLIAAGHSDDPTSPQYLRTQPF